MFLALDLSVKSTGFAFWREGHERPVCGVWPLAPGQEWAGRAFVRLHKNMMDLHTVVEPITNLMWEEPLPHWAVKGQTSIATLEAASGLSAHAWSFAEAVGARWAKTNQSTWRRHFLGAMKRGTKTVDLKALAMTRCRELGFDPERHDAAEACGLLDYQISMAGIIAPWRQNHILVEQFTGRKRA